MLISAEDITLRVGEQLSFAHTTWYMQAGQHWAILGPTGSGKTTLARGLSRQLPLVQGQISFFFDEDGGVRRPYLHPNELLTFSAETHQAFTRQFVEYHQARWQSFEGEDAPVVASLLEGLEESHQQMDVVERLGIRELLARKVHQLSHGESRKIFLARLLLRSPRLLILDDPYSGLDAQSRMRLKEGIEALLKRQDPAVLFLSARYEDIPLGIDHFLLVSGHRVVAQGERQSLLADASYRTFFTAAKIKRVEGKASPGFTRMVERYADALAHGEDLSEMVAMRDVSVTYQGRAILQEINWTVRPGEHWVVSGPNGAGKTMLLSLILADHPQAYTNDMRLFGQQRGMGESIWQIKHRIGWVSPELHAFYDRTATVRQVVSSGFFDSVGLFRRCTPEQTTQVSDWMDALDLTPLAERPFFTLSTGQQRLVLLARALVKHPPLLVLDEPCQGLDDAHRFQMIDLIDRLCRAAPVTLIYVSHYQEEIPATTTHRLSLLEGRIEQCGRIS